MSRDEWSRVNRQMIAARRLAREGSTEGERKAGEEGVARLQARLEALQGAGATSPPPRTPRAAGRASSGPRGTSSDAFASGGRHGDLGDAFRFARGGRRNEKGDGTIFEFGPDPSAPSGRGPRFVKPPRFDGYADPEVEVPWPAEFGTTNPVEAIPGWETIAFLRALREQKSAWDASAVAAFAECGSSLVRMVEVQDGEGEPVRLLLRYLRTRGKDAVADAIEAYLFHHTAVFTRRGPRSVPIGTLLAAARALDDASVLFNLRVLR